MHAGFQGMQNEFKELVRHIDALGTRMDDKLTALESRMEGRFTRVDDRFSRVDDRFARVEERFTRIDAQFYTHLKWVITMWGGVIALMFGLLMSVWLKR